MLLRALDHLPITRGSDLLNDGVIDYQIITKNIELKNPMIANAI